MTMASNNYHTQIDNNDVYSTIIKPANPLFNPYNEQSVQNYSTINRRTQKQSQQQNNSLSEQQQNQDQLSSRLSMPAVGGNIQSQTLQKQRPIVTVCYIFFYKLSSCSLIKLKLFSIKHIVLLGFKFIFYAF